MRLVTSLGNEATLLSVSDIKFDIDEVAWALSQLSVYGGHSLPYSLARHCVAVSHEVNKPFNLAGLLHDAHKAYCGGLSDQQADAINHLSNGAWREYETVLSSSFRRKFSLPDRLVSDVVVANRVVTELEMGLLFDTPGRERWNTIGFKTRTTSSNLVVHRIVSERGSPGSDYELFMRRYFEVGNG